MVYDVNVKLYLNDDKYNALYKYSCQMKRIPVVLFDKIVIHTTTPGK